MIKRLPLTLALAGMFAAPLAAAGFDNELYLLDPAENGTIRLQAKGADGKPAGNPVVFAPTFRLGHTTDNPQFSLKSLDLPFSYTVPTWKAQPGAKQLEGAKRDLSQVGEGFEEDVHGASLKGRTLNIFEAAGFADWELESAEIAADGIDWKFKPSESGRLEAKVTLPAGSEDPVLRFRFTPAKSGWFTINYAGAPAFGPDEMDELWQPLVWLERKSPAPGQLTLAFRCPIPTTLVQAKGLTLGVLADSRELPFMPLPTRDSSRFAVGVRDRDGSHKPMMFAPALGIGESQMKEGQTYEFVARLYARPLAIPQAFEDIGKRHFGFRDFRTNALGSLNDVLFKSIDYGMGKDCLWSDELRGFGYSTDVPGAVKNVSSLHPLNLAMVTDDPKVFEKRAKPMIEYMLSREKFLFDLKPEGKGQYPSSRLFGPCAPLSELVALHRISGTGTSAFATLAESIDGKDRVLNLQTVTPGKSWQADLAMFRLTGDKSRLEAAIAGADKHIGETLSSSRKSYDGFFWTQFVADWMQLLELYEASGEKRFLEAAHAGARRYAMFCWLGPQVPDTEVLVNEGGWAPHYYYLAKRPRHRVAEETVPAWRLSEIGLTPESSSTCAGHRAIFMAHHSTWFMKIASLTGDAFLHDLARHGVIGRSKNFPGYHINTARTTAYEKEDFPLRPHEKHSVNSFHYNHVFPFAVNLLDYMVSDAHEKSGGRIDFPSEFIEGYAYLQNRFHGHKPGTFFGAKDAVLWMPRDLLETANPELNWIAARGEGKLYLALMNQSPSAQPAGIKLNPARVSWSGDPKARALDAEGKDLGPAGKDGWTVPGGSMIALVFEDVEPVLQLQQHLGGTLGWKQDFRKVSPGDGCAMRLSFGESLQWIYAYFRANDTNIKSVTLRWRAGASEDWQEIDDRKYPFEFTMDLPPGATAWEGEFVVHKPDGSSKRETVTLSRH